MYITSALEDLSLITEDLSNVSELVNRALP